MLEGCNSNIIEKLIIDLVKSKFPHLVQKCLYKNELNLVNFTVDLNLIVLSTMMAPAGIYRTDIMTIFNGNVA